MRAGISNADDAHVKEEHADTLSSLLRDQIKELTLNASKSDMVLFVMAPTMYYIDLGEVEMVDSSPRVHKADEERIRG